MNKFIGQKLITKKWLAKANSASVQEQKPWIIFEKEYLQRNADELAKIGRVKDDLHKQMRSFSPR